MMDISWDEGAGSRKSSKAKLLNVSFGGVQLEVDSKIRDKALVACNNAKLGISGFGVVRYCDASGDRYLIGLEFSDGTGWRDSAGDTAQSNLPVGQLCS